MEGQSKDGQYESQVRQSKLRWMMSADMRMLLPGVKELQKKHYGNNYSES